MVLKFFVKCFMQPRYSLVVRWTSDTSAHYLQVPVLHPSQTLLIIIKVYLDYERMHAFEVTVDAGI